MIRHFAWVVSSRGRGRRFEDVLRRLALFRLARLVRLVVAAIALALTLGLGAGTARADGDRVVELYTIGEGPYLYARYGHSLLCVMGAATVVPGANEKSARLAKDVVGDCYDFGVPRADVADGMFWHSYRGKPIFITAKIPLQVVLDTFRGQDRTIERQRLPLSPEEAKRLIEAVEGSAARGDAYAYHPATANCATRVRDVLNEASGDRLRRDATPTKEATLRELMEQGLAGHPLELGAVELTSGVANERYPSTWEAQMLPFKLRDAVADRFGVKPVTVHERVEYRLDRSVAAGRVLFVLLGLLLWGAVGLSRRDPSGKALGLTLKAIGVFLGGLALTVDVVALTCTYVETHKNWVLLALLPTDLALGWLTPRVRVLYTRGRIALLALLMLLEVVGVIPQVLLPIALMAMLAMIGALRASSGGPRTAAELPKAGPTKGEPAKVSAT
ncbi:MAG TPA: DUF4105 domain-containing protein [Polyangiaceae bacterium]|nr:DUF4105 domain-containing protein [Polyangiaceae bacterium]